MTTIISNRFAWVFALLASAGAASGSEDPTYPIAGTTPDQRLPGAPVLSEFVKDKAWYDRALHGVERPYPPSLRFLEDQGAWHTPFNHPGMPAPYDLRGWYRN